MHHLLRLQLLLLVLDSVDALPSFLAPVTGPTIQDEITCYGIPYGLSFASHLITYYTLFTLWHGRQPLSFTWEFLEYHAWDMGVAVVALVGGNTMAIFTVIRCRNRWQFVLIAFWKMSLSTMLPLSTFTTAYYMSRNDLDTDYENAPRNPVCPLRGQKMTPSIYWIPLYMLGLIVGLVGVFSLVKETWLDSPAVRVVTYVFGGIFGAIIFTILVFSLLKGLEILLAIPLAGLFAPTIVLAVLGVFYSDWILAAVAGNMAGLPSSDVEVLYWLYFAFKRVPLLSF
jgi:hypothetical protein